MNRRFGRKTWSILVPNGWSAKAEPECVTLVGRSSIGALQLSAAFKDTTVLDEDLADFAAEHLQAGARAIPTAAGDFVGFEITFADGDHYWRQWFLRHGQQALFVTYNCDVQNRGREDAEIADALASLSSLGYSAPWWQFWRR